MRTNTDNPEQTELKPPDRITVRVCRCGVLVAGVNACPHCGAGWAQVKTPPTEYARVSASSAAPVDALTTARKEAREEAFKDVGQIIDAAGEEWGKQARDRRSKTYSAYVIAALDLKGRIAAASPASTQEEEQVPEP